MQPGVVGAEDSGSDSDTDIRKNNRRSLRHPMLAALLLISIVVLMTCIFSSLDNAVTLVHAGGSVDIGQYEIIACGKRTVGRSAF